MRETSVDVIELNWLFTKGMTLREIANKFGVSEAYIQQIISRERKKNPEKWPLRQVKKSCDNCKHFSGALGRCMECIHSVYVKDHWEGW